MEQEKYKNMSFPKFVVGNLPLSVPLSKEDKQPFFMQKVEDPRQKHSGMTPSFMGFTLIELLVVVLIIGILAAVALPQYQKAVEKSRAAQAISLVKSVHQAVQAYYLANNTWPTSFDELSVDIPWTGTQAFMPGNPFSRSNGTWSLELYTDSANHFGVLVGRLQGPYKNTGFMIFTVGDSIRKPGQLLCLELNTFDGDAGDYCQKIWKAGQQVQLTTILKNVFTMP